MNILKAIEDEQLFRPFFGDTLSSWQPWNVALRCLYGLPVKTEKSRALVQQCTGRDANELPPGGFSTALFLTGRRSGKSRIAATVGAFEALFGGHEKRLAKGETGLVPIISPTKYQSTIVWNYLEGLFDTPLLQPEISYIKDSEKFIVLRNGIEIRILVGDFRSVRGPSVVCAIIDEACFFHLVEEGKCGVIPHWLATTRGKLVAISSKYSKRGWAFGRWLAQHGSNRGVSPSFKPAWTTLVWDAPSKVMNETLSDAEIAAAYDEDPAAARSEFGGEWREDIAEYVPRSLVESLVIKMRKELTPRREHSYVAFSDLSGGRNDAAALAIAHKEGRKVILDFLRIWKAPFNPHAAVAEQAEELKRFGLRKVTGDNYAAEFVAQSFKAAGINYVKCDKAKSELYRELLPRLCSAEIELLDSEVLIDQLAGLERRTRSGGNDIIDHGPNGKDDAANAVAGACVCATGPVRKIGLIPVEAHPRRLVLAA